MKRRRRQLLSDIHPVLSINAIANKIQLFRGPVRECTGFLMYSKRKNRHASEVLFVDRIAALKHGNFVFVGVANMDDWRSESILSRSSRALGLQTFPLGKCESVGALVKNLERNEPAKALRFVPPVVAGRKDIQISNDGTRVLVMLANQNVHVYELVPASMEYQLISAIPDVSLNFFYLPRDHFCINTKLSSSGNFFVVTNPPDGHFDIYDTTRFRVSVPFRCLGRPFRFGLHELPGGALLMWRVSPGQAGCWVACDLIRMGRQLRNRTIRNETFRQQPREFRELLSQLLYSGYKSRSVGSSRVFLIGTSNHGWYTSSPALQDGVLARAHLIELSLQPGNIVSIDILWLSHPEVSFLNITDMDITMVNGSLVVAIAKRFKRKVFLWFEVTDTWKEYDLSHILPKIRILRNLFFVQGKPLLAVNHDNCVPYMIELDTKDRPFG